MPHETNTFLALAPTIATCATGVLALWGVYRGIIKADKRQLYEHQLKATRERYDYIRQVYTEMSEYISQVLFIKLEINSWRAYQQKYKETEKNAAVLAEKLARNDVRNAEAIAEFLKTGALLGRTEGRLVLVEKDQQRYSEASSLIAKAMKVNVPGNDNEANDYHKQVLAFLRDVGNQLDQEQIAAETNIAVRHNIK